MSKPINKYLSFDITLHKTLSKFNQLPSGQVTSLDSLLSILHDNWLSLGYNSKREEDIYKIRAVNTLIKYYYNPKDKGEEIILIDKFIKAKEDKTIYFAKIDKLHFLEEDTLEVIDYKSGWHLPPKSLIFNSNKVYQTLFCIYSKFGCFPQQYSFYYLRHNFKYTMTIDEIFLKRNFKA